MVTAFKFHGKNDICAFVSIKQLWCRPSHISVCAPYFFYEAIIIQLLLLLLRRCENVTAGQRARLKFGKMGLGRRFSACANSRECLTGSLHFQGDTNMTSTTSAHRLGVMLV